jgi:hypothetical protein
MDRDRLLWNAPPPPTRGPKIGERVWSLTKGDQRVDAELFANPSAGCEVRLLRDGEFYAGRRFERRADAFAHAERLRQSLEIAGWSLVHPEIRLDTRYPVG